MKNQNKTAQTTVSISKKYPKLSQYEELSDINLSVVAGGMVSNTCVSNDAFPQNPGANSVKGA